MDSRELTLLNEVLPVILYLRIKAPGERLNSLRAFLNEIGVVYVASNTRIDTSCSRK